MSEYWHVPMQGIPTVLALALEADGAETSGGFYHLALDDFSIATARLYAWIETRGIDNLYGVTRVETTCTTPRCVNPAHTKFVYETVD